MPRKTDTELGLDRAITRRDFIHGSSLVLGGAAAGFGTAAAQNEYAFDVGSGWYGPGGVGDYAASHGNTPELVRVAHEIRAGRFDDPLRDAIDSGEFYDLVVVGGGFSGLSAAHHFRRLHPAGRALILDNHPIFGGEAKRNEFDVDGVRLTGPQGSNDFRVQRKTGDPDDYFTALDMPREYAFAEPTGTAAGMRIPLDNYDYMHWQHDTFDVAHFFRGAATPWVKDVWRNGLDATPWSPLVRDAFRRLRSIDTPEEEWSNETLDGMTLKAFYTDVLGLPPETSNYYDPIMASIAGLGCDVLSAYWGRYFEFPGFVRPDTLGGEPLTSFPGGNAAIARYFVRKLVPGSIAGNTLADVLQQPLDRAALDRESNAVRLRLEATAVRVEHAGSDRVSVAYWRNERLHRVHAKIVVMGSGGWVNRRVLRDLPQSHVEAYASFRHAPVLVANVALRNWRFLAKLGVSAALWSGGFGFTCNIRRPMIVGDGTPPLDPDKPIVMTFYAPVPGPGPDAATQGATGRALLLSTSFADYERQIREQMSEMFGAAGFDAARDIAGIILNRWGHAYLAPEPGFRFGTNGRAAPPDVIREPLGRIAIGHSELRGHQYWSGAAGEGRRAVELLLDRYF
ncbi:MAG: NAD(P)/FAD-dependent oxidoreductase [Gammaproteobacteria bacterium]|nr:NAD(P)/FAD-dependent oxidoreductase [Gammaproteobacteria bacterium]MDH4255167.1 NAD(P)/FAD-dependent oxidoreductase [Gammaproteobacteria bacterium]MDH5311534.1 NAD(P)/FAD-dependent oxidoreductase [Gammaproteobacteria bacterium]